MATLPTALRKKLFGAAGNGPTAQLLTMVAVASCIFIVGILVGSQFFDPHRDASARVDPAKPWDAFTRSRLKVPPGIVATSAALESAAAGDDAPAPRGTAEEATPAATIAQLAATGPRFFADFDGRSSIEFDAALDAPAVSAGAWIYLDSRDSSSAIKTVLSNRQGGCKVDAAHRGFSLYVNNWETNDRALVLEWRNSGAGGDGCARLSSDPGTIPYDTWVHVGFALPSIPAAAAAASPAGSSKVMLFLNGELLKTAPGARRPDDVHSAAATDAHFTLGATADRQMAFNGRIANVFVARTVVTPRQLVAAARMLDWAGWRALADAGKAKMSAAIWLGGPTSPGGAVPAKDLAGTSVHLMSSGALAGDLTGQTRPTTGSLATGAGTPRLRGDAGTAVAPAAAAVAAAALPAAAGGAAPAAPSGDASTIPASIRRTSVPGTAPAGWGVDVSKGGNQWVTNMVRVPLAQASGDVADKAALAAGTFSDEVTAEQMAASDELGRVRAAAVKAAMVHAWSGYRAKAWGSDELKPRGGYGQDNWAGMGMTLIDSLDTLWLMGMKEEFAQAREWVATKLSFDKHTSVSVFETTIRALGGLLAAYDLSGDKVFLEKAKDLGNRLLPAFNTPTGIPRAGVVLATGQASAPGWTGGSSILSELGTLQVEFRNLARVTGEPLFARKAEAVIEKLDAVRPADGLYPIYVSADSGTPTTSQVTFGALGDSFYEYLIKVWLQGGRAESMYRRMYDAAMQGMTTRLLKRSRPSSLLYVADWDGSNTADKMDHLVCFVPGMLALGAFTAGGTAGEANAVRDLTNAKALAYTCWQMYERQATGIAPEFVEFPGGADLVAAGRAPFYLLRPEAAESLFILHQLTGNPVYREWGWRMFQAIDKHCKVEFGYGAHPDVRDPSRTPDDRMERCVAGAGHGAGAGCAVARLEWISPGS